MTAALMAGLFLLTPLACGSDDSTAATKADSGSATTIAGSSDAAEPSDSGATEPSDSDTPKAEAGDPCRWYTAAEMEALVGAPMTMKAEDTPSDLGKECVYDNPETSVTVRPGTAAMYDSFRATAKSMNIGGPQIDFPGVGDEAFHDNDGTRGNPSVSMSAKAGDAAITVELATVGSAIASVDTGIEIVSTVAKTALDKG